MIAPRGALRAWSQAADELGLAWALIGGLAASYWGTPRQTLDIDVLVAVDEPAIATIVERLLHRFRPRTAADAHTLAIESRVLPLETQAGSAVDVVFALLPFERDVVEQACVVQIEGTAVRLARAEDLIVMKAFSERPIDRFDAEAITRRQAGALDRAYVEAHLGDLERLLEREDLVATFRRWLGDAPS